MILNDAHVRYSAADYNRFTENFVKPYDEMLVGWLRKQAKSLPPDFTLVDIGTGTAQILLQCARLPEFAEVRLIGTDLFPDMIAEAEATVAAAGLADRIRLMEDDIHASKLPSECADLLISRSTLHHWVQPAQGLREIYRILKPDGVALITDVRRDAPQEAVAEFNRMRAEAGLGPSVLDEKFNKAEVEEFVLLAGLEGKARVAEGTEGLQRLGLSVWIRKPK